MILFRDNYIEIHLNKAFHGERLGVTNWKRPAGNISGNKKREYSDRSESKDIKFEKIERKELADV